MWTEPMHPSGQAVMGGVALLTAVFLVRSVVTGTIARGDDDGMVDQDENPIAFAGLAFSQMLMIVSMAWLAAGRDLQSLARLLGWPW